MPRLLFVLLICLAPSALAEVYRCVDPATGKTTFTDMACASNKASNDKIEVKPGNFGASGHPVKKGKYQRAWRSQDPARNRPQAPVTAQHDAHPAIPPESNDYQAGGH